MKNTNNYSYTACFITKYTLSIAIVVVVSLLNVYQGVPGLPGGHVPEVPQQPVLALSLLPHLMELNNTISFSNIFSEKCKTNMRNITFVRLSYLGKLSNLKSGKVWEISQRGWGGHGLIRFPVWNSQPQKRQRGDHWLTLSYNPFWSQPG